MEVYTMIIDLPEKFTRTDERGIKYVYIEDGILKLRFDIGFKGIMKELVYSKKGYRCFYCGKVLQKEQITIDHLIPQTIGGPTITNNLVPACKRCNEEKNSMTEVQYEEYLCKPTPAKKREYVQEAHLENELLKAEKEFGFLNDWVIEMPINKIKGYKEMGRYSFSQGNKNNEKRKKTKYSKIEDFYHKYGRLHKAIVVDRNNRLLGGFTSLMFAKNHHLKNVPVIKIENVEIFY